MAIDRDTLEKVALVARLPLTDDELEEFLPQVEEALEAFKTLQEVDTSGVEPSFHPVPLKDATREDAPGECLSQEEALSLTSHKKDGYFKGPKAV